MEESNTTNNVQTFEYTIRTSVPSSKKHFVARFPEKVDWPKWTPPIKLVKSETVEEEAPALPTIPTTGSRSQKRRQLERFYENKKKEPCWKKEKRNNLDI